MASSGKRARVEEDAGPADYEEAPALPSAESLAALRPRLLGLSREQLADLLINVIADGSLPEETLLARVPAPSLRPVAAALKKANAAIRKSLPNSRFGSGTDAFCYRRCATHVTAFKKLITDEGKTLETAGHWPTVLRYCVLAWTEADESVTWDEPNHNAWRGVVQKNLDRLALKASKGMIKDKTVGRATLEQVLEQYGESFPAITAPLQTAIAKRKN